MPDIRQNYCCEVLNIRRDFCGYEDNHKDKAIIDFRMVSKPFSAMVCATAAGFWPYILSRYCP